MLFWQRGGSGHRCFKSFLQEYQSLGHTAGPPSFHGGENAHPCEPPRVLGTLTPGTVVTTETTAQQRAPARGGRELISASRRERRGAELPNHLPPLLLPSPAPLAGRAHSSLPIRHGVQILLGGVLRGEGCVVPGFACLAHLFCILPDVMFSLLCLF